MQVNISIANGIVSQRLLLWGDNEGRVQSCGYVPPTTALPRSADEPETTDIDAVPSRWDEPIGGTGDHDGCCHGC